MNIDPTTSPNAPERIVLTLLGPDRSGIVARIASIIADHGGNWMESRMVRLGGQFAGIVQAQVPPLEREALLQQIDTLRAQGLQLTIDSTQEPLEARSSRQLRLELVAPDRPGILKEISGILAAHAFNVEELATEFVAAPWSGEMLFKAQVKLSAGETSELEALREDLESTSAGMMLDVSVQMS